MTNPITTKYSKPNLELRYDEISLSKQIGSLNVWRTAERRAKASSMGGSAPSPRLRVQTRRKDSGIGDKHVRFIDRGKWWVAFQLSTEREPPKMLDGRKAFRQVESLKPDIVIMDLAMPHFNRIEATYQIKQMDPKIKVIIFTIYPYREFIRSLIKSGISGYVLKASPISDLYLAIQVVKRGGPYFTEDIHDFLSNLGDEEKDPFDSLSRREREVFQLLAEGPSVREAGELLHISSKTVETHKYHIMRKLVLIASAISWERLW